ncbi:kinesin-like protein KIF28P isoform X3 [Strongylocentrotus purpuratus]|uniref:Kinesin-like protein 6 n=1 Tax=Strongylocentrotus purpuratus TaxID=7668 RepID=A0A7M7N686_STRPU|nr:kinesin-like protein KIF28P isoform X3 [Strongylocentrotus purpuratus]
MSGGGESVKVAVRVRPFNSREKERGAKCCVEMSGATTKMYNPEAPKDEPRSFTFDHSYWSHDGFTEDEEGVLHGVPGSNYASQQNVFDNLGQGVLDNAFKGFNCSLFAYGQTGSGKSYSMVGYGKNKGIVPITCDALFKTIEASTTDTKYEVTFSMLEIYNEQVRDLLQKINPKGGLPVRQNPKEGIFYVQNLKKAAVGSYKEIERKVDEGTANRTVAATQMNATSSRAHTVITITFNQISKNDVGQETKKTSVINLVDLAGSERADSTGATGDRLKEGANINKSLSALGNVISALADLSMGKKKIMVPYRDSVLTKLLQNALGGNSKTIMIAALSPADINFDETIGTLRYADRAKKIKNKAVVNENPVEKLIRELREENEKLKKSLGGGVMAMEGSAGMSPEEIEAMKKQMEEEIRAQLMANQEAMSDMDWDSRLQQTRTEHAADDGERAMQEQRKNKESHFANLNEDNVLSGVILHFLGASETTIGRKDASPAPTIPLSGLSIQKQHALVKNENGDISIKPATAGAKVKINGMPLVGERILSHLDRVMFGSNHLYIFKNPSKPQPGEGSPATVDWDFAQKELAQAKGFNTNTSGLNKDQQRAQDQILELLPMVNEVNAVNEELNKHKNFEIVLISGAAQDGPNKETKVMVKMTSLLNGNEWLWERGKFINRRYVIQDMYQRYLDGDDDVLTLPKEEDPFWEPPEDVLIGTSNVFLQSLSYALDFDDKVVITDFKGNEQGYLVVSIAPCNQAGKALPDDEFVDDPSELLGKPYHIKVVIRSGEINKSRFSRGTHVKYRFMQEPDHTATPVVKDTLSPEWKHSRVVSIPAVDQTHLDFFDSQSISFQIYGQQVDSDPDPNLTKLTTKELRQMKQLNDGGSGGLQRTMSVTEKDELAQIKSELVLLKKKHERLEKKERRLQDICKEWEGKPPEEQQFAPFFRSISAVANSTGQKLKTRVQMLNKMMSAHNYVRNKAANGGANNNEDTVSVYSFELDPDHKMQPASNKSTKVTNGPSRISPAKVQAPTSPADSNGNTKLPVPNDGSDKKADMNRVHEAATGKKPQSGVCAVM